MVATLAFSLYLTHKEVGHVVSAWLPGLVGSRGWISVPVYAVSCLAGAALLYFAVERPMLAHRDRRERRRIDVDREARAEPAL
jgi:peptidoglycan/LPS O-acetylase OafA/YrhL